MLTGVLLVLAAPGCGESGPDKNTGGAANFAGSATLPGTAGSVATAGRATGTAGSSGRAGSEAGSSIGGATGTAGSSPSAGSLGNAGSPGGSGAAGGGSPGGAAGAPTESCPGDQSSCEGSCVNLQGDVNHCGRCANRCPTGATCSSGACYGGGTSSCAFSLPSYDGNASLTYYTLAMGSKAVNCSYPILGRNPDKIAYTHTGDGQHFGAMNTADYNSAAVCGACVEVRRDDGRKVTITIVDQCPIGSNPKCKKGHIDLSRSAFNLLGTSTEGYLGTGNGGKAGRISWKYVPCPGADKLTYRLKEPSNPNWNEILVGNTLTPITKLEALISGSWQAGKRQEYNYWSVSAGALGAPPWLIRVTDLRGNVTEHTLQGGVEEQLGSSQFPACQ